MKEILAASRRVERAVGEAARRTVGEVERRHQEWEVGTCCWWLGCIV